MPGIGIETPRIRFKAPIWCPSTRLGLIAWIKGRRPDWVVSSMPKKQLQAIYFKLRGEL